MTEAPRHDDPLAGAVVRMRRVSQPEAPFDGWLARVDETVVQLVDTTQLRGWPGWRSRGEHVLSVHDVARVSSADENGRAAGHEAILPWCVERVETFVTRRSAAGAELTAGEVVTLVVSLIRGCASARGADLGGVWWLTQDGTPTFVGATGTAAETIGHSAASLIERLAHSRIVGATWRLDRIASLLHSGEDASEAEAQLFAVAEPEPLVLAPLMPRRATDARRAVSVEVVEPERRPSALGRLLRRHIDLGVAEMVSDAVEGARRGAERVRRRIARPWLVAAGIAGVVVVGGLAWPTSAPPAANARSLSSDAPATSSPDAAGAEDLPADAGAGESDTTAGDLAQDDPARALAASLDIMASCADAACAAEFFEDASATEMPPGAVDLPAADRLIALLDDLGGVAILSVTGADGATPAQLVVLVRAGERWVIRDVRDVEAPQIEAPDAEAP